MGWETWIITTFSRSLAYGTPLLLGTLGEIYAERSGVLNLGVEGMMIMGAYSAFTTAYITGNPWLGILVAAVVGGAFSLIHAFASVTLKANQVVSGLSLTMLGLGLSGMFGRGWEGKPLPVSIPKINKIGTHPIFLKKNRMCPYFNFIISGVVRYEEECCFFLSFLSLS